MKIVIDVRKYTFAAGWLFIILIPVAYVTEHMILVSYLALSIVIASFYLRRKSISDKLNSDPCIATTAIILFFTGIWSYNAFDFNEAVSIEILTKGTLLASILIAITYVYGQYQEGNISANSWFLQEIQEWDVFSDRKTEVVTAMDGNIVSETRVINKVASKVSYEDAINTLKQLYAEGKDPHAVSSVRHSGLAPMMDHSGTFIGFKYDNKPKDYPFEVDPLDNKN